MSKKTKKRVRGKRTRKPAKYPLKKILKNLEEGEAGLIGVMADMGDQRAESVIAQYVWYLRHPKDPERVRLLEVEYERYKKDAEKRVADLD